ncbi:hypothetical protein [Yersinia sp. Marseille-Q3913]|uniref:hypothetical protein n=1 Tax=Yersinia sp. Marseille-Q3913 TaxID=2830769 RepID=UPI001BB057B9|nr:hypothetical protein [Yersinia sp. Marseille-Q3913]MBS0057668.1 hypothetical protein [Yersinia sp. Marseille-Q3913]
MSDKDSSSISPSLIINQDWGINKPQTVVRIFVDTASVAANCVNGSVSKGIYMLDNRKTLGSSGQGTLELNTCVRLNDYIGFYITPIDPTQDDEVSIEGFEVLKGDLFGSNGYPELIKKTDKNPTGPFWIAQALNNSNTTYRLRCKLVTGGLRSRIIYFQWDPYMTVAG